ncbi:hypothetical protein BpHYR1_032991 [Brachionus plicatilis]|uniref:Uncharacterized protein n=1 Tax=Brachionus plicatilis TaxID=10195 RepID=A0A3M7RF12_BRAPC|nr:hypothetical protein BpHYR1_032991 [Brachionus plicatilis]
MATLYALDNPRSGIALYFGQVENWCRGTFLVLTYFVKYKDIKIKYKFEQGWVATVPYWMRESTAMSELKDTKQNFIKNLFVQIIDKQKSKSIKYLKQFNYF